MRGTVTSVAFDVAGIPVPQGSMKGFARGNRAILTSDNERLKPWRTAVTCAAADARGPHNLMVEAVEITMHFRLPVPKTAPKRKRLAAVKRPDLDKLTRAVLDALTGVLFADDSQVVRLVAEKVLAYDSPPGVAIVVQEARRG